MTEPPEIREHQCTPLLDRQLTQCSQHPVPVGPPRRLLGNIDAPVRRLGE